MSGGAGRWCLRDPECRNAGVKGGLLVRCRTIIKLCCALLYSYQFLLIQYNSIIVLNNTGTCLANKEYRLNDTTVY